MNFENRILTGNAIDILKTFPDNSVDCCVTSPPYFGLRVYSSNENEIGKEATPEQYCENLCLVFHEVQRVLKPEGTFWLNIGDSYSHSKSLIGIPWRAAFMLQKDGWILRQDIIWAKRNPMPESCKDRFCKSHEYLFLFVKQPKYYFNHEAALEEAVSYDGRGIDAVYKNKEYVLKTRNREKKGSNRLRWPQRGYAIKTDGIGIRSQHHGKNIGVVLLRTKRDVWFLPVGCSYEEHFAVFPENLITPCILCGCPENGIVLDPFMGSGTTAIVAMKTGRKYVGCELNPEYVKNAEKRIYKNKTFWDMEG